MTSARRPIDSPLRSATGRLSSRDRRSVALLPAGALGPGAGVVVMRSLFSSDADVFPAKPRVVSSASTLTGEGERTVYGVVPTQEGHDGPRTTPSGDRRVTSTPVVMVRSLWRRKAHRPDERRRSVATRKAAGLLDRSAGLPDTFWYSTKRRFLGPPLVNQDLGEQRLSKPLALGVLSPDGISSSA